MSTFIMLTRLSPDAVRSPSSYDLLERRAAAAVEAECPQVEWLHSYATLGPYDYVDVFRAPDSETAMKVAALVRLAGHAHTEVWAATTWEQFKQMMHTLPEVEGVTVVTH